MPRYDDRYGATRLYVGHLSSRTRTRDLEDLFSRYGRVRDVDIKNDYAFVEFSDPRDADDARYSLNGRDFDGSRIVVEFAKGAPRGSGGGGGGGGGGGSREYAGRGPPPGSGRCFNCGIDGHWARDCKAGDWKNKCYRCGERGHIEKNCHNSPKSLKRPRSYSRSPSPRARRVRSRSRSLSYSRSRSNSRSRSPAPRRREHSLDREDGRSRSPRRPSKGRKLSRSPDSRCASPQESPRGRKLSRSPDSRGTSPQRKLSPSPDSRGTSPQERSVSPLKRNGSDYNGSPKRDESKSPASNEREANGPRDSKGSESPRD